MIADEVLLKLRSDANLFEQLVARYSDDEASAAKLGAYKDVKRGSMVDSFDAAAFSLEPGEISAPVLTQYGYHIIRLDGINEAGLRSFESVKNRLKNQEKTRHKRRIRTDYINQLTTLDTMLSPEAVRKMLSRYVDPSQLNGVDESESE